MRKISVMALLTVSLIVCTLGYVYYVYGQRGNSERWRGGEGNIPPFMKEILDQEGISPDELQNNPELRQKVMEKMRQMRNNPEFRQRMPQMGEGFRGQQPAIEENLEREKGFQGSRSPEIPQIGGFQMGRWKRSDLPEKYRMIAENNLFRPLGYEEPRSEIGYRLVGIVADSNVTKALLVESNGNSYYVKAGDRIRNAVVDKVLKGQVVLIRDGKPIELRLEEMQFMSSSALAASSGEGKGQPGTPGEVSGGQPGGIGFMGGSPGSGMLSEDEMRKMRQGGDEQMRAEMRERWMREGGGRMGQEGGNFRGGGGGGPGPGGDRVEIRVGEGK